MAPGAAELLGSGPEQGGAGHVAEASARSAAATSFAAHDAAPVEGTPTRDAAPGAVPGAAPVDLGETPGSTLVVGMGNPIVSDDAVGVRLATDLKQDLAAIQAVDVVEECACGGLDLLDLVVGYDRLIVLDAIKTMGGVPGSWYELTAGDLRETLHLRNVHDVNLATALALGRRLGFSVPGDERIHILAVEVEDVCTFAEAMTPALEAAYPDLAREILGRVMALLRAGNGAVV